MIRGSGEGTRRNLWARIGLVFFLWVLLLGLGVASATAAPKAEAWTFWAANDPAGMIPVDHAPWDRLLKKYVVTNHPSAIHRVRYASVTPEDRKILDGYIPRGMRPKGDRLLLSDIYDWFQADFGGSEEGVLRHLQKYAGPDLAARLKNFKGSISYEYDWRINAQ